MKVQVRTWAAVVAAVAVAGIGARAAPIAATADHSHDATLVLSDSKLTASFSTANASFGFLFGLTRAGGSNLVATPGPIWAATLVGLNAASATISPEVSNCTGLHASQTSPTLATLVWSDCTVPFRAASSVAASPPSSASARENGDSVTTGDNVTWVEHKASNCAGTCLPKDSSGPNGGHCDRMPGCGHDAGLPYCDPDAMKARCLAAQGCTAFNTNGYLYAGGGVTPFSEYPLSCFTDTPPPPPPPPPATVTVTASLELTSGQLGITMSFEGDGRASLWDYTVTVSGLANEGDGYTTASTNAARQFLGLYDPHGAADAVYFAAHDPEHTVKSCSTSGANSFNCNMLALNATLPLQQYTAAFPVVVTVLDGGDWWDLASVYRAWVLPNAVWTRMGRLDARTDLPDWLENITLWVNNNWGGDPLGPNYGGDPEYVKVRACISQVVWNVLFYFFSDSLLSLPR